MNSDLPNRSPPEQRFDLELLTATFHTERIWSHSEVEITAPGDIFGYITFDDCQFACIDRECA